MNFPTYIAKRYLFAKKSHNAINIISAVSVACITIGTMALIIVLSVFNGFNDVIKLHFNAFDPEIKITATEGKTFIPDSIQLQNLSKIEGVAAYSKTVEENVLLKYDDKQYIATIKGVDDNYLKINRLDTMMVDGEFVLKIDNQNFAVVGQGIAYFLEMGLQFIHPLQIYILKKNAAISVNPLNAISQSYIFPKGFFAIEQETDAKYLVVPIHFAFDLLEDSLSISALEVKTVPGVNPRDVKSRINALMGKNFQVKDRLEQKELFYRIMKYEKWAIFLILGFILLIAFFNVIGSLAVLIIEKRKDIGILSSLGADYKTISRIFQFEGLMISFFGGIAGLLIGLVICWLQQKFGLIKLAGNGSFIIDAYPVSVRIFDIFGVLITVLTIGFSASWYTVKFIIHKYLSDNQTSNS